MTDTGVPRRGLIAFIALLMLAILVAFVVWWSSTNQVRQSAKVPDRSYSVPSSSSSDAQPDVISGAPPKDQGRTASDQSTADGQSRVGLTKDELFYGSGGLSRLFLALTPEESEWKDWHGFPSKEDGAYDHLSVDQLVKMAKSGDRVAAVEAAGRLRMKALNQPSGQELMERRMGEDHDDQEHDGRMRDIFLALRDSAEWERYREMLWLGVVHGSSWAASEMSDSFKGPFLMCYFPVECDAWTWVAWRMGDWGVTFGYDYSYQNPEIADKPPSAQLVMQKANAIWNDINAARTDLGLPPLEIDLRPAYDRWMELESTDTIDGPIYPR